MFKLINKMVLFGNLCRNIEPCNFVKRGYRSKRRMCSSNNRDNDPNDIRNKVVVTTGAAEGIGYEMSRVYLEKGAKVAVLLDNNTELGYKTQTELRNKYGREKVEFMHCDIRCDLEEVYPHIIRKYHTVDVLINNAGVLNDDTPRRTIEVNVIGTAAFALRFWQHMRTDRGGKGGTIINLSSIYGYRLCPCLPFYQCTQFAIMGLTKALGHEKNFKKSGVRVVSINPGYTYTRMTKNPIAWEYQEVLEKHKAKQDWQDLDAIARGAIEVFEKAPSGTAWLIEGNRPICRV